MGSLGLRWTAFSPDRRNMDIDRDPTPAIVEWLGWKVGRMAVAGHGDADVLPILLG
jgi:hypothetical protein